MIERKSLVGKAFGFALSGFILLSPSTTLLLKADTLENSSPVISNYSVKRPDLWGKELYNDVAHSKNGITVVGGVNIFKANFSDVDSDLVNVQMSINSDVYLNETNPINGNYSFSVDTLHYTDGIYNVVLKATDSAEQTTTKSYGIQVDNTAPTINYGALTPLNGTVHSGNVVLDVDFADEGGIYSLIWGLDGNLYCEIYNLSAPGYQSCTMDTTKLLDGTYHLTLWAKDKAGNSSMIHDRQITVLNTKEEEPEEPETPEDTTAPVFVLKDVTRDENESYPPYSEFIASNPENLTYTCSGLEGLNMTVSQPNLNKLVPVTCTVTDASGNSTTSTSNLIVNNVQPSVVIIANPSTNVNVGNSISLVANILKGNSGFTYTWTGACSGNGSKASTGLTNYVNVSLSSGSYICGITVTDADGDTAGSSVLLGFASPTNNNSNTSSNGSSSTNTTTNSVDTTDNPAQENGQVEGANTVVSAPQNNVQPVETTNNTAQANTTTSPLVMICLVAGGILIIGLLLFLFFRGEDEELETAQIK